MGVAYVFSKIQPKATIIATIALVFVALALYLVPGLGLIFALFAPYQVSFYGINQYNLSGLVHLLQ